MKSANFHTAPVQLTREVLLISAPEEVLLLDYIDSGSKQGGTASGPLGFGSAAAAVLIAPILVKFFEKFLEALAEKAANVLIDCVAPTKPVERSFNQGEYLDGLYSHLVESGLTQELSRKVAEAAKVVWDRRLSDGNKRI